MLCADLEKWHGLGGWSTQGGIYVCLWLIHFIIAETNNIVKPLFFNVKKKRILGPSHPCAGSQGNGSMSEQQVEKL